MEKQQPTLFQQANQAFSRKDYATALELYEKSLASNSQLKHVIAINIALTKKRLAFKDAIVQNTKDLLTVDLVSNALVKPESLEQFYFDQIVASGLFDSRYYAKTYPQETKNVKNLLEHYLTVGVKQKLNPSIQFNTDYYLRVNPDVAESGVCPFIHYVCNGQKEGREAVPQPYQSNYEVAPVEYVARLPKNQQIENKTVRVICFYLPQFHAIKENDEWWGKGFTEWTNVKPALPQFEGHYQPHKPHEDIGYYNLLDRSVQLKQIELAKQYGIEGFCYYLYWFSGQRLLEQPLDNMLADPTLDFPFCVCWANENWSRRWDGKDQDLLMQQNYSDEDDLAFIAEVSKYLKDHRYIKINGKPLLMVYRPNLFPDMKATSARWRNWCYENGIGEIYLAYTQSFESENPAVYGFDAAIEFPPNNSNPPKIIDQVSNLQPDYEGMIYDWRIFLERSEEIEDKPYKLYRGVTPSWDNTARKKNKGNIFHNSCPKLFTKNLVNVFSKTVQQNDSADERLVFINAWNEWAEGAHLEPDQKYGYAWLQSVYDAHQMTSTTRKKILIVSHDAHPHGAQILSLNFAKYFSQQLHFDVEMIVLGEGQLIPKYKQYANVQQIDLNKIKKQNLMDKLQALRNKLIDVAIVNTTVSGKLTLYLKQAGFSVVSLIHELPSVLNAMKLQDHAKAIAKNADKIVFPANQVKDGFETFIGQKLKQSIIRPQGIYLPSILREGADKKEVSLKIRKDLDLPNDAQIIMCAGYADHRKGFDYFVEACCDVMTSDSKVYGLWVGHMDKPFVEKSMLTAKQKGLENRFVFTGLVDDTSEFYVAANVYALTSREDPFPSVVMEALDALTPVVAFKDCGGFENLLVRECGLLVEKDNVEQYAAALKQLLNDDALSERLARTGQNIIQTELSFHHYLYDLLEFAGQPLAKVTVAVPNYNYSKYIESRLDSIVKQTYPIYELIVLDDVSTDDSVKVIKEYLKNVITPHRLIINEQNSGSVFKQWQKAAELARGDYLWIAEADDLAQSVFLETLIPFFIDLEVVLAFTQSKQIDENGLLLANDYLYYTKDIGEYWNSDYLVEGKVEIMRALSIKNTILNVSGVLFRKDCLLKILENEANLLLKFKVAGDWLIYLKMVMFGKVGFISKSLNLHRRHINSVTKVNNHLDEVKAVHNIAKNLVNIDSEILRKMDNQISVLNNYFSNRKN